MKEYVISYKVRSLPYWYTFTCYEESADKAVSAFWRENPFGIEAFRIVAENEIK